MRFGLVGTGHWALTTHGRGLVGHPGSELVGVWGRDPGRTADAAQVLGARPYADVNAMFADVDAVAFAVPPAVQAPLAARAAAAGKHLLLDKPLAIDPAAADAVVAAVEGSGVASIVFFTNLFVPGVREWIAQRRQQHWDGAFAWFMGNLHRPGSPYANSPWREEYGGLWDTGPHALSLLIPLLGPIVSVTAVGGPRDTVALLTNHQGGALGSTTISATTPEGAGRSGLELWGTPGIERLPAAEHKAAAIGVAVDELLARAAAGPGAPAHEADVHLGALITHLLADASAQLLR